MNKKGYFFLIDAIIALFVIGIGITLVITTTSSPEPVRQPELLDIDLMNILQQRVNSIDDDYCGAESALVIDGNISDPNDRLLQQFGSLYYRDQQGCVFCIELIQNCINSLVLINNLGPYSIELNINHKYIHAINTTLRNESRLVIPQRSITFGVYHNQFFGPYTVEMFVWN